MAEYLKLDSTRVTLREYWDWKPGVPFLFLAVRKMFGWRLPVPVLVPAEPAVQIIDPSLVDAGLKATVEDAIQACEAHGRTLRFWYQVPTIGSTTGVGAALGHPDRLSVALAVASQGPGGTFREVSLGLVSRLRDGRFIATGLGKTLVAPPPEVALTRLRGRTYRELIEHHDARLSAMRAEIVPDDDAQSMLLELQRLQIRANVTRGVYVRATGADIARMG